MVVEHTQTLTVVAPVSIADVFDIPYSPVLLLDARFDVSLTDDVEFQPSCEWGFDVYFEDMYELPAGKSFRTFEDLVLVEKRYSQEYVLAEVKHNMQATSEQTFLVTRAGVTLGWLSALALTQREFALKGLALLASLVEQEQCKAFLCAA